MSEDDNNATPLVAGVVNKATGGGVFGALSSKVAQGDETTSELLEFIPGDVFVDGYEPPEYLVPGIFQKGGLFTLTGPTGAGKTNIGIHLAVCVAQGSAFHGHPSEQGRVLFFAGENPRDVKGRMLTAFEEWCVTPEQRRNITFVEKPFDIEEHIAQIQQHVEQTTEPVSLVIVDTLMAFFNGDNDNDNKQMQTFGRVLRLLLDLPGEPLVLVPSHPALSATKEDMRPRGGGAFLAEIDGNYCLWPYADKTSELYPHAFKFRGAPFPSLGFRMKARDDLIKDCKGNAVSSVIAVTVTKKDVAKKIEMEIAKMDKILLPLDGKQHVPRKVLVASSELSRSTFDRKLRELTAKKLIETNRGSYTLTTNGKKWVEAFKKATNPLGLEATEGGE